MKLSEKSYLSVSFISEAESYCVPQSGVQWQDHGSLQPEAPELKRSS